MRRFVLIALVLLQACSLETRDRPDAGKVDAPRADATGDLASVDAPTVDRAPSDKPIADKPIADKPIADKSLPDKVPPDVLAPDKQPADLPPPDLPPLKTVADDSFADFHKGTLSESGAKIYVSAKGNVQLLDRHDINGDGWLDIVFGNAGSDTVAVPNAYIYWGAASGFSKKARTELPVLRSISNAVADLNADGFPDLVFSNYSDGKTYKVNSYIYWGSASGFKAAKRTELPTLWSIGVALADLDADGHLDVIFTNGEDGVSRKTNSYIYWGSSVGYSTSKRTELPTIGGAGITVADLDRDGRLDIVFANSGPKGTSKANSYIYWGAASGFSSVKRTELPTLDADDVSVADLNADSYLDIVFSNRADDKGYSTNSYIYWGTKSGFSTTNRSELPPKGGTGNSVADLNGDGFLDILFSNNRDPGPVLNSYIYWGTKTGLSPTNRTELPAIAPYGNMLVDLDADGYLDIVFCNSSHKTANESVIYWGAKVGFATTNITKLPTITPHHCTTADTGSVYSRDATQMFTSRALDTKSGAPKYQDISWAAKLPNNTSLKLQLRSAVSAAALAGAKWHGPTSTTDYYVASPSMKSTAINKVHHGDRFFQYRALLSSDFGNTPVLDRVAISYR